MGAGTYNIKIEQGTTWSLTLTFYSDAAKTTPIDVSTYAFKLQMRTTISSAVLVELTSPSGGIDMTNAATGIIVLNLTATETAALNFDDAVYDLESTNGATVVREVEGVVTLSREVTR